MASKEALSYFENNSRHTHLNLKEESVDLGTESSRDIGDYDVEGLPSPHNPSLKWGLLSLGDDSLSLKWMDYQGTIVHPKT